MYAAFMKNLIIAFALISFSGGAFAGAAERFLREYLDDFASGKDLSHYFAAQPQFIFGSHCHIPASATEASEFITEIRSKLVASGYEKSQISSVNLLAHIDKYRLVSLTLTRLKQDGTELDKVCSSYGLREGEDGFKILSWQPSNPNEQGLCP
ncbi:hypothetical protein STH12_01214 [Shewanella khirikhana]|uniref:SnoaL-like domain-containing protein n=2 Tax=Shewanella khirikhana TaxID=1965282 RepID=A0ABN5TSL6_9GAMM|nr:hypothetical protein STH12_01214 [Shewanella khirikhana]